MATKGSHHTGSGDRRTHSKQHSPAGAEHRSETKRNTSAADRSESAEENVSVRATASASEATHGGDEQKSRLTAARDAVSDATGGAGEFARGAADKAGEIARDATDKATEFAREAADKASELASEASDQVRAVSGKAGELAQDAQEALRDTGRSILSTIKGNPLPAAMVGIGGVGLALLLTGRGGSSPRRSPRTDATSAQASGKRGRPARNPNGAAATTNAGKNNGVRAAGSTVQQAAGVVSERASALAERASETLGAVTKVAGDAMEGAQNQAARVEHWVEDNPLGAAASALAIGLGIGLLIPSHRREHEWFGSVRDQLVDRAHDYARSALDRVEAAAEMVTGKESDQEESAQSASA